MLSFILSFFPKTGPYFEKKCRLRDLKNLKDDWVTNDHTVNEAISVMRDFIKALDNMNIQAEDEVFTVSGFRSAEDIIKTYIGEDTSNKLMNISKECIMHQTAKELRLDDVKDVLLKWDGKDVDEAYKVLKHYARTLRKIDPDMVFFGSVEEFVKHYLGEELYERLETMIRFFEKLEELKRKYC